MEQRLIDANALMEKAIEEKRFVLHTEDLIRRDVIIQTAYQDLADFIDSVPEVDAVEVVRCGECKHRSSDYDILGDYLCEKRGCRFFCKDNDFCSYGERRGSNG